MAEKPPGSTWSEESPLADSFVGDPAVRAEWDERHQDRDQLWSGRPNAARRTEIDGLSPGRVLDVGCGEGADAVWLAGQGWDVTALEVVEVDEQRPRVAAEGAAGAHHARDLVLRARRLH